MIKLLPLLILLLCSCTSSIPSTHARVAIQLPEDVEREDTAYESIELSEIKTLAFDFKQYIATKGTYYSDDRFDCDDYARGLVSHTMITHRSKLSPAIGHCKVLRGGGAHMLVIFNDNKHRERYFDVQLGHEVTPYLVLYKRY